MVNYVYRKDVNIIKMEDDIKKIIGERIKENRLILGLTQEQLAKKLGVSTGIITAYERGLKTPSDELKSKICDLFNISFNDLMGYPTYKYLADELNIHLPKLNLSKDEYHYIYNKLYNFYCKNGSLKVFKSKDYVHKENINNKKIEAFLGGASQTLSDKTYDWNSILYHIFKRDRRKYLQENPNETINETFLRDKYSSTFKKAFELLDEDKILHKYDIPIFSANQYSKHDNICLLDNISLFIIDYLHAEFKTQTFGLLITNESMLDRYRKSDLVLFDKCTEYTNNEDYLITLDNKLLLTKIQDTTGGIIITVENGLPRLLPKIEMKRLGFKVVGKPFEIKINYERIYKK